MLNNMKKGSKYALLVLIIAFILITLVKLTSIEDKIKDGLAAIFSSVLVLKTNEERQSQNLEDLKENELLVKAAQLKADDMAKRGFFAHVNPDGKQPWYYLDLAGYKYKSAGENLAVNFKDSKQVHKAWMNSPTHKANIIQPKFTEIGIATADGFYQGQEVTFVVQFFAAPKLWSIDL